MPFTLRHDGELTVVAVEGALVEANSRALKRVVGEEIARGGRRFRVDARAATYMDSSALGALVSVAKSIRAQGGEIRIAHLNADLRTLFELTRLDTLLPLDDERGDSAPSAARIAPSSPSSSPAAAELRG